MTDGIKLNINFQNCYGIEKFEHAFSFNEKNKVALIYAPNGSMKTSFAKAFKDFQDGKNTETSFGNKTTSKTIKGFAKGEVFVIHSYEDKYQPSADVAKLLASDELKQKYDETRDNIKQNSKAFFDILKKSGLKEDDIFEATNTKIDVFKGLESIMNNTGIEPKANYQDIKYGDLFNDKTEDFLNSTNLNTLCETYINAVNELIQKSDYYSSDFKHYHLDKILDAIDRNNFFKHKKETKENKIILANTEFNEGKIKELKKELETKKQEALKSIDLKQFEGKQEVKKVVDMITNSPDILLDLSSGIEQAKKNFIKWCILQNQESYQNFLTKNQNNQTELQDILKTIQDNFEKSEWTKVVKEFNTRFEVPFTVEIDNVCDTFLNAKKELKGISFKFKDEPISEEQLRKDILSQGEKRALYLLKIIFDIEARKDKKTLFIIDDIADSFDYQNKYAIIEYLKDISENQNFYQIIMTHNYDFYRTVKSRIYGTQFLYSKEKTQNGRDSFYFQSNLTTDGTNNPLKDLTNATTIYKFLALIPLVRNLTEYRKNIESDCCQTLTNCLHYFEDENDLKMSCLKKIFENYIQLTGFNNAEDDQKSVRCLISKCAGNIVNEDKENLEHKVVLSIAIRLKAEKFMYNKLIEEEKLTKDELKGTQTGKKFDYYKKHFPNCPHITILRRVVIMTPENIHLNSFMFEPIVDMSGTSLKKLYEDVLGLFK